jgi:hypothetical protein
MGAARPFPPALHIFAAPQGKDNDEKSVKNPSLWEIPRNCIQLLVHSSTVQLQVAL